MSISIDALSLPPLAGLSPLGSLTPILKVHKNGEPFKGDMQK
jgi:hypothetical protein